MVDCGLSLPCESTVSSDSDALKITNSGNGPAIAAIATGTALTSESTNGTGVIARSVNGEGILAFSSNSIGLRALSGSRFGVYALTLGASGFSPSASAVFGESSTGAGVVGSSASLIGVYGRSNGIGTFGISTGTGTGAIGVYGAGGSSRNSGFFDGNVRVLGTLTKGGGGFKIDHPLEPTNKYLSHSFVESPDMLNVYNGNVTTDANGDAVVVLPDYFEALNQDFRYQLTVIGQFAQAIVAEELRNNQFTVKTDRPNVKASWQITGIRKDSWAQAHPLIVEEEKPEDERGYYQHPELYNQPRENSTFWKGSSELLRQLEEQQQDLSSRDVNQVGE